MEASEDMIHKVTELSQEATYARRGGDEGKIQTNTENSMGLHLVLGILRNVHYHLSSLAI
jgi:hypothetical protein